MMVDIANRALSPAVNDPTTAVQVLDHIGEVLGLIGRTDLDARTKLAGADPPAAVVMVTRRWEDFVTLGLTEIREFGATSVQIMRRLRALLEELLETVRPEHRAPVEEELRRLDATVADGWRDSVDLDRASEADRQGIGGPAAGAERHREVAPRAPVTSSVGPADADAPEASHRGMAAVGCWPSPWSGAVAVASVGWPSSASQPFSTRYIAGDVKIGSAGAVSSAG